MSHVISASGLTMRFPGCLALDGVEFQVPAGTVFALLGENGAGKTTLIRILTGFLKATGGTCQVLGLDPERDALEIRRRVGYVSDAPALYDWMKVGEIGWFTSSFYPPGFLDSYRALIRRYEVSEDWKIRRLSKGQRAKVALALALASRPGPVDLGRADGGARSAGAPRVPGEHGRPRGGGQDRLAVEPSNRRSRTGGRLRGHPAAGQVLSDPAAVRTEGLGQSGHSQLWPIR
jgi:ABC-type transport system involved in cytochrome c biogenesis ATPase subunit